MTKNSKTFMVARTHLVRLDQQLTTEAKADPRLARTKKRCHRMVAALDMALKKYEQVHSRKVPTKIAERKAGAVKKVAKKAKRVKKAKVSNVVELKPATAAAARKRALVKRSR